MGEGKPLPHFLFTNGGKLSCVDWQQIFYLTLENFLLGNYCRKSTE